MINKEKIAEILRQTENVKFAYLFGSRVKNKTRFGSDLDIAIYFKVEPQLLEIGKLVIELEKVTDSKIDLVLLNNLYEKNPKLSYSIIDEGTLLFCEDEKLFKHYKKMVFIKYLDFKPIIDFFIAKLNERLANKKFAVMEK